MTPDGSSESEPVRPLTGRRVVITRSVSDNHLLAGELARLGAEVVQIPTVEVLAPTDGGRAMRSALDRLKSYRYVVLTSANGVAAVAEAMVDRPWPSSVPVVPVGPVTEQTARAAGMITKPPPSEATAAALVAEVEPWPGDEPRAVLAPLAELATDVVVDGLEAKGYVVDRVDAYRTAMPVSDANGIGEGVSDGVDAVLFFAPSAVDRFLDQFERRSGPAMGVGCVTVCIGPATASRAAARALPNVVVADPHTESGVVSALVSALR